MRSIAIISNSKPQIPMSALVIFVSFLVLAHNVNSASFKFDSFSTSNGITFQGDSFTSNNSLQLTSPLPNRAGRASFSAPVQIWDAKSGRLTWFTTTFSFVLGPTSPNGPFGDGFSFFLAPFSSNIPQNSNAGYLGLFNPQTALDTFKNQIVAVEFDTFGNSWDPAFQHMGIDINSIASVSTVALPRVNVQSGLTGFATVNYEPNAKNLSVILTYPQSKVNVTSTSLSFTIDLRTILPEWVRVGFSASTGQVVELHKIFSWSFSSSFN